MTPLELEKITMKWVWSGSGRGSTCREAAEGDAAQGVGIHCEEKVLVVHSKGSAAPGNHGTTQAKHTMETVQPNHMLLRGRRACHMTIT